MQSGFTLRPLGLGDILDVTLKLYRQNFALFVGIYALVLVPVAVIQLLLGAAINPRSPDQMSLWFLVSLVLAVVSVLPFATMIHAASARYLGRTVTTVEAYNQALPR